MTPEQEQLEVQSREAIKAWCDDPSVQLEFSGKVEESWEIKNQQLGAFDTRYYYYRIAKPKKFYRVGQDRDGQIFYVSSEVSEKQQEARSSWFYRWLDERKYYE